MKSIIVSVLVGLVLGWGISRSIGKRNRGEPPGRSDRTSLSLPEPFVIPEGKTFGQARAEARALAEVSFNPFRSQLQILDQIQSLSKDRIGEAFRSGDIRDQHGVSPYGGDRTLDEAFEVLAKSGASRALGLADEIVDNGIFEKMQNIVLETCLRSDPNDLLRVVESRPEGNRRTNLVRKIAKLWAQYDPRDAADHLIELNDLQEGYLRDIREEWDPNLASELLAVWATKDFDQAERWVLEESDPRRRDQLHKNLLSARLRWGGKDAVDFIVARGDDASRVFLKGAFLSWAYHRPEDALERFATMLDEPDLWSVTEAMGKKAALGYCSRAHKVRIPVLMEKFSDEVTRKEFMFGALLAAGEKDLKVAGEILSYIPESNERKQALAKIAEHWLWRDPATLKPWIRSLASSESRDFALARIARKIAESNAKEARAWVEFISDEIVRERVLTDENELD